MKQEANRMIIQSKKIWLADQFVAGQIEIVDGKIVGIYDYDEKEVDKDYGDNSCLLYTSRCV